MANAKSRVKAPKSATTKGKGNKKESLAGKDETPKKVNTNNVVMRRPSNLKLLSPDEKVQYFLQNGHLLRDKFPIKSQKKHGTGVDDVSSIVKAKSPVPNAKNALVNKNGKVRKRRKKDLELINELLKSELMINDAKKKRNITKDSGGVNNNNDADITDQNSTENLQKNINKNTDKNKKDSPKARNKKNDDKNNKTKHVTLSNGLVLTLSMFQCDICKKNFTSKSSIRRHMYAHLNLKPFPCPHCRKKFRNKVTVKRHMKYHHGIKINVPDNYLCDICNRPFRLKENLALHLSTHVKTENSYKCIYCDKKFSYHLLLVKHEKQHLVTGRYQCTLCNMSYECRNQLAAHVKGHLKIKDYICQYCGKEFLRLNSMRRHVQICHGGQRIQCPICKKSLKGHLTEHMRTHEKRRPHKCPDCGQCFTQSTQLNVHRRSHTGARPYPCRICDKFFSHSNALMLHIRRHTGEKPFPCALCPLSFSQLPHMKAHMRKIHGKENPYRCTKCNQYFKLKVQLENHSKTCTVGDRPLTLEEKMKASMKVEEIEAVESGMTLPRMRFLLALLFTMIATKEKLKYLGFNKRLIDELLEESLEAMGQTPCKDDNLSALKRLKTNIQLLLKETVPQDQMEKFQNENKSTEELLELLTDEKKKRD
ncbi:hypothetical protein K1T71_006285 [Dendrolimus kikuchii]|uniref:Uncharacterized protein n=1 Tax=Dendrolimus kikuchii TaxID=765133 RepID=A0ACC1D4Y0_9NEOP|nr:hypothetical protein K1T71_006285 [Dendrolimus kikuchii]